MVALFLRETLDDTLHNDDEESRSPTPEIQTSKDDHEANEQSGTISPNSQPNYGSTNEAQNTPTTRPTSPRATTTDNDTTTPSDPLLGHKEVPVVSGFSQLRTSNGPPMLSTFKILSDKTVRIVLLSYFCLAMISTSNDVIFALWMFLPVKDGGIGFTPAQIATALSAGAILGTIIMVFLFPALHRRVGTLLIYRCAMFLDIVFIALYPLVYFIATKSVPKHHAGDREEDHDVWFKGEDGSGDGGKRMFDIWKDVPVGVMIGIGTMLVVKALAGMTWGCNMILVTASAPTPRSLGTVNSMAQMAASLARAIGPPIYSSVFAVSIGSGILGGKGIIWIFMGIMGCVSLLVSFFVREGDQDWRRSRRME